ncbi:ceramidase [Phaeosphaeriaceae sp. PMI808]|nr:ceramidase [Phaeosphaeriaceae sp. PMI808]
MAASIFSRLPSIPYPLEQEGRWSPVTSTLDWCEENYVVTQYSAEIVNTLTNLLFVYLAVKGIRSCIIHGHDTVFLVSFIGYLLVGSGSFLFHATLKYPMQLVDELSMIYTTCLMNYATFSYGKSRQYCFILGTLLVSLSVFITLYYHYLQDPSFHQNAYTILTVIVLVRTMYIMEVNIRPKFRSKARNEADPRLHGGSKAVRAKQDENDKETLRLMWKMIGCGLSIFVGGFVLWHLDNVHCSKLIKWRREIGMPWGFVLEGHGWWHLMTGAGAYFYIVWGVWLRHQLNHRQDEYELVWPNIWTMPDVVRRKNATNQTTGQKKEL